MAIQSPFHIGFNILCISLWIASNIFAEGKVLQPEPINAEDTSDDPYIFESESLPVNWKYYPSVGNGHLATNIYRDAIHVNGLYSGPLGWSHRARVPAHHACRPNISVTSDIVTRRHRLDTHNGIFEERTTTLPAQVTYRTYAHQYYTRVLVTEIAIERNLSGSSFDDVTVTRQGIMSDNSLDLIMQNPINYTGGTYCWTYGCWSQSGTINQTETSTSERTPVHVFWTEMPDAFTLTSALNHSVWTYMLSVDQRYDVAKLNFDLAAEHLSISSSENLLLNHTTLFNDIWRRGNIEVTGDNHLAKVVHGSLYYLYTSLPTHSGLSPPNQFSGLSPGGLPNGANNTDYQGHVFWDMETWMYPAMLLFRPDLARDMLSYRIHNMDAAFARAASGDYLGTRFPWESAFSGVEVTPDICPKCRDNQQHITGDIAFAARQYVSATRDLEWLSNPQAGTNYTGARFILEMARFWHSRPTCNLDKQRYDVNNVMPPDEHAEDVNNSVYTNVAASLSVHFSRYALCLAGDDFENKVPDRYIEATRRLAFTYHTDKRYHEEFEGYDDMATANKSDPRGIKQADVILLGFPFLWQMPNDVRRNDLNIYEAVTNPNGPAMTWGMYSVGWLELGDFAKADDMFQRGYLSYVREPFKIWTEVQSGVGAVNFITGMGGFLQSLLFGYGGLRLHVETLDFRTPRLPPGCTALTFRNLNYLGSELDVTINATDVTLVVTSLGDTKLTLTTTSPVASENITSSGFERTMTLQDFTLKATASTGCPLPTDDIVVDYSPVVPATTVLAPVSAAQRHDNIGVLLIVTGLLCIVEWY